MYQPRPIDTTTIELPPDLLALVERLAEHNHDVWAESRIRDGWTHGEARDDVRKTHPDLVPYCELSESEKDYDRATSIGVLKAVMSLGYIVEAAGTRTQRPEAR